MYRVVRYFEDLQDNSYAYNAGDKFPRDGMSVSQDRIDELASANNKQGTVLIRLEEDAPVVEDSQQNEIVPDDAPVGEPERVYDENSLSEMTTKEIKMLATSRGYKITKFAKADVIDQFLKQQG